jgi:hypothetical protein
LPTSLLCSFEERLKRKTLEFAVTSAREGLFFQIFQLFPPCWLAIMSEFLWGEDMNPCPPTLGIINIFQIIDNSLYLMRFCALKRFSVWREKCILIWGIPRFYRGAKLFPYNGGGTKKLLPLWNASFISFLSPSPTLKETVEKQLNPVNSNIPSYVTHVGDVKQMSVGSTTHKCTCNIREYIRLKSLKENINLCAKQSSPLCALKIKNMSPYIELAST